MQPLFAPDEITLVFIFRTEIIMSDESPIKQSRLLLPPVRLYSRNRTSNQIIKKYLGLVKNKKNELEEQLRNSNDISSNLDLSYLKHQHELHQTQTLKQVQDQHVQEEQLMARGSIDSVNEGRNPTRGRFLHRPLGLSTLSVQDPPYKIIVTPSKPNKTEQSITKKMKCQTEPGDDKTFTFDNSPFCLDKPENDYGLATQGNQRTKKKSKHQHSYIHDATEVKLLHKENSRPVSRQEIQGEEFISNPVLDKFRHESIEASETASKKSAQKKRCQSLTKADSINLRYLQHNNKQNQFKQAIESIKHSAKTNERLERAAKILEEINPFFKKIERVISVCLLRIGKIQLKQAEEYLYQSNIAYSYFYIILSGKIKLIGKHSMHKVCQTGETILEELVFEVPKNGKDPVSLEKAKLIEDSWVLRVELSDFCKLERQLVKYGFRKGLIELRNIMKRNQIVKNWVRNKSNILNKQ